jgi:dTDP-4-amino-4,6-dideoxygalactose transaminase
VVLATGWYILGNEVKEFETSFAKYWDTYALVQEMVWMLWF